MNKYALVLFLGIVMTASTISISFSEAIIPENLPDVVKIHAPPFKDKIIDANGWRAVITPLLTTTNNPSQYESGVNFPGVAVLLLPRTDIPEGFVVVCTGSLIAENFILTAAHCVTNDAAEFALKDGGEARFGSSRSSFTDKLFIDEGATQIHPLWNGDVGMGRDVAVLKLVSPAPAGLTIYGIDRDESDDLDDAFQTKVGYGRTGTLDNGEDDAFDIGTKRDGENKYDDVIDTLFVEVLNQTPVDDFIRGSVLLYDSDNGQPQNDAFDFFLGDDHPLLIDAVGRGVAEVNSAGGDSGGPSFNGDGEITGITSFGMVIGGSRGLPTPDCDINKVRGINRPDSSCGEFSGDMRVSQYFTFIDSALSTTPQDPTISIDDVTLAEGNSPGTTDFEFIVTRSSIVGAISLNFDTADDTATTADGDYVANTGGTINFSDGGSLTDTITVVVNGDDTVESDETFFVNLTNCSGCTISDNRGVGTITNDDTPVGVTVSGISHTEIAKGTTLPVVLITGSGFVSGASVTFENGCGPSPSASVAFVSGDGTTITAEITAKSGGPPRPCTFDVRVTNENTSTNVLLGGFTVVVPP